MEAPVRRHRFPGPGALIAIYLGIGTVLHVGLVIYVRYFKEDYPFDHFGLFTAPLPLSDRLMLLFALWIFPIVAWPLIWLGWLVSLVRSR